MGQFGPAVSRGPGLRRFAGSGVYAMGALLSSAVSVYVLDAVVGAPVREALGDARSLLVAAMLGGALLLVDALRVWAGSAGSLGLNRQTPYAWRTKGAVGIFGWGLDTGLPVSTIRSTPLPMLGVILVAAGHGGPLHGLAYGLGITAGVVAGLVTGRAEPDVRRVMDRIQRDHRRLGPARLVVAPSVVVVAGLVLWWSLLPSPGS